MSELKSGSKKVCFSKDFIIVITHERHADYDTRGLVKVLKDFDMEEQRHAWGSKHANLMGDAYCELSGEPTFMQWLIAEAFVEELPHAEINLGYAGEVDLTALPGKSLMEK